MLFEAIHLLIAKIMFLLVNMESLPEICKIASLPKIIKFECKKLMSLNIVIFKKYKICKIY